MLYLSIIVHVTQFICHCCHANFLTPSMRLTHRILMRIPLVSEKHSMPVFRVRDVNNSQFFVYVDSHIISEAENKIMTSERVRYLNITTNNDSIYLCNTQLYPHLFEYIHFLHCRAIRERMRRSSK